MMIVTRRECVQGGCDECDVFGESSDNVGHHSHFITYTFGFLMAFCAEVVRRGLLPVVCLRCYHGRGNGSEPWNC
jgi:hypothetical protein